MKKTILILAIIFILFSCSNDGTTSDSQNDCACYKVYYDYKPISYQGGAWIWGFVETSKELFSSGGNCQLTDYIQITGGKYYRIECR
jgi:hypothetical protein